MLSTQETHGLATMHLPRHGRPVEDAPQATPDAKACPSHDGEGYVKLCTRAGIKHDEGRDDSVPNPNTDPCLPPGKAEFDHRRDNHPSIETEYVR